MSCEQAPYKESSWTLVFATGARALDFMSERPRWELSICTWAWDVGQIASVFWASVYPFMKWKA